MARSLAPSPTASVSAKSMFSVGHRFFQRLQLGLAAQDRLAHFAGQRCAVIQQGVAALDMKAGRFAPRAG